MSGAVFYTVFFFLTGCCVGSFLNVCIYRLPAMRSVVWPGSRCPRCFSAIRAWDNVPVLSWFILGGRCRDCGAAFSMRYALVEFMTGLLFAVFFWGMCVAGVREAAGPWPGSVLFYLFAMYLVGVLIVASFIDFEEYILPDGITLGGTAAALVCAPLLLRVPLLDSVLGAAAGAGLFWGLQAGYRLLRKAEGMGTGDIKLMALLGALNGWQALPFTILAGSLAALAASLIYLRREGGQGMKTAVPFGPFLTLGGLLAALVGDQVTAWYLGLMR